jgi:hypothetical protein
MADQGDASPPHRSTTVRPSTTTLTAAPTSPLLRKFSTNASFNGSNAGSHWPWITGSVSTDLTMVFSIPTLSCGKRRPSMSGITTD